MRHKQADSEQKIRIEFMSQNLEIVSKQFFSLFTYYWIYNRQWAELKLEFDTIGSIKNVKLW